MPRSRTPGDLLLERIDADAGDHERATAALVAFARRLVAIDAALGCCPGSGDNAPQSEPEDGTLDEAASALP